MPFMPFDLTSPATERSLVREQEIEIPVVRHMAGGAKPVDIQRTGVITVMGVDLFGSATTFAGLPHQHSLLNCQSCHVPGGVFQSFGELNH